MNKCRACLATEHNLISFDQYFVENYNILTNLNVAICDGLPQYSCLNCKEIIRVFIEFRTKAIASETSLREHVEVKQYVNQTDQAQIKLKPDDRHEGSIKLNIKTEIPVDSNFTDNYVNDYFYEDYNDIEPDNKDDVFIDLKKDTENIVPLRIKSLRLRTCKNEKKSKIVPSHLETISKGSQKVSVSSKKKKSTKFAFLCGLCKVKFEDKATLCKHLETHKTKSACELCTEQFTSWQEMFGHRIQHLPKIDGRCHVCNKHFATSTGLEFHYLSVHGNKESVSLKCKFCLKSYSTPRKVNRHVALVHSSTKPKYICDYCSKRCKTKNNLRIHIMCHMDSKRFKCDLCEFSCKLRSGLEAHKIRKHSPDKVICKQCKRPFKNQQMYDEHTCSVRLYVCSVCGKECSASNTFRRHMLTHNEERRFKCDRCPMTYRSALALKVHRDRHDGVRRYLCEYCPASFYCPSSRIKHHRTHTGEKPYVCEICKKAFMCNFNLKTHMKVHGLFLINHKNKDPKNFTIDK